MEGPPKPKQPVLVYQFPFPKTKKVAFHNIIRTEDPISRDNLSRLSAARDELCNALDANNSNSVFACSEKYLPCFFGLVVSVEDNKNLRLNSPLNFHWTSIFSGKNKPPFITCFTYRYEVVMAVFVYAIAHINKGYDEVCHTTESNLEENSKKSANHLRTAAGILEYIMTKELPRWLDIPADKPMELYPTILQALSDYCTATAQCVTLNKALIEGKTSRLVMSKLAVDVWRKMESVLNAFKTNHEYKEMSPPFKSFIALASGLGKGMAFRYMGDMAHEEEKWGTAVSFLNIASTSISTVWVPSPGTALNRYSKEIEEARDDIEHMKRSYANENNHIYYQPVTAENSLEIPEAKCLMTAFGWVPPQPIFNAIHP